MSAALTAVQRLFFETHGYLMVDNALTGAELASVRAAADRAERRWRDDPKLPGVRIPEFLEIDAIMEYEEELFDLVEQRPLFPMVRELVGADIAVIDHGYYITPPGGALDGDAWHRDVRTPGVYHPRSTVMVRAMYALTDVAEDGGATLVLPGSHRFTDEVEVPRVAAPEEMPGAVALTCKAGGAYFFNGNLLHAPSHNRSSTTRRMLLFNYGHKWMRMWRGHEPSAELAARAVTPMRRQLLGLTGAYFGDCAELEPPLAARDPSG